MRRSARTASRRAWTARSSPPSRRAGCALGADGTATLYFDNGEDPWVCTYDARYLRITAVGQANHPLSVGEVDVFGPSGDNVELTEADGIPAIGVLKSDFEYQPAMDGQAARSIPKGSVVFTGSYKGNPAYNVVMLYDEAGNVVGGTDADGNLVASQIILAPDPGDALLGETSEGRWVYWIEPGQLAGAKLPAQVRAELYRVDDALDERRAAPDERLAVRGRAREAARDRAAQRRLRRGERLARTERNG